MKMTVLKVGLLCFIVLLAVLRSWYGTRLDSFTVDEPFHMVAGISYVQTGDFRLNPEHPPLSKLWVGWLAPDDFSLRAFEPLNDKYAERNHLEETMFFDNDFAQAQQSARLAMWLFNGLLMAVLLLLVWHLWRFTAAIVVGLLMVFEPTMAAHMPLVMTDLPVSLALAINALTATGFARQWRWHWGLALALATGVALSTKFSALPGVLAIYLVLVFLALKSLAQKRHQPALKRLGATVLVGVLSILLLWASYGFQYHASPDGGDPFNRSLTAKIDDLSNPSMQSLLLAIDQSRLLPKAYVWGLADTIKAGIEGRGRSMHFVYGHKYTGDPPWFFWPANIMAKLPIPYLFMLLMCVVVVLVRSFNRWNKSPPQSIHRTHQPLLILLFMAAAYLLTLMNSAGTYAGIRHALPLVVVIVVFCGVIVTHHWQPLLSRLAVLFILATALMTARESRLWEYHNETAGGTENAYQYFASEGLDLGQRVKEIEDFIQSNDLMQHNRFNYIWLIKEELEARGIPFSEKLSGIDDDNYEGIFEGYFFMKTSDLLPWDGWDPSQLNMLDYVDRIGNVYIMKGRYVDPMDWARLMRYEVRKYIMETDEPEWEKVALRLEQVVNMIDIHFDTFVDLGNAYVKTKKRSLAIAAYQNALNLIDDSKGYRRKILTQIELLQSGANWSDVGTIRPDNLE
ncbi:ArnT family glycosyltransferase [Marinicella meishanensis]|uniref:ArnT family glycosyltransferase n=1 Tax=Marinicella meishanensis TaxID=2873263 RepID=UPI001CBE8C16|nr:hypothetical protein [Marinicella sp. NBU2979]